MYSGLQLIINSHLTDTWQMAQNLTDNWQMGEILADNLAEICTPPSRPSGQIIWFDHNDWKHAENN